MADDKHYFYNNNLKWVNYSGAQFHRTNPKQRKKEKQKQNKK